MVILVKLLANEFVGILVVDLLDEQGAVVFHRVAQDVQAVHSVLNRQLVEDGCEETAQGFQRHVTHVLEVLRE